MHDNGGVCGVGENLCRREICDVVGRSGEGDESFRGGFVVKVEEGIVGGGIGGVVVVVGHWVGLWRAGCSFLPLFFFFFSFFWRKGGREGGSGICLYYEGSYKRNEGMKDVKEWKEGSTCRDALGHDQS